ncbi:MAG: hypothetical protein ABIM89_19315 [Mycobacteriales bacterium]
MGGWAPGTAPDGAAVVGAELVNVIGVPEVDGGDADPAGVDDGESLEQPLDARSKATTAKQPQVRRTVCIDREAIGVSNPGRCSPPRILRW